jgi:hypothetical protein
MSQHNLVSTVSRAVESGRDTARHVVGFALGGANRAVASVDARWARTVDVRGRRLSPKLRSDLVAAQREITGIYTRGAERVAGLAHAVIDTVADVTIHRLEGLATNAAKLVQLVDGRVADRLAVVAMPGAQAASDAAAVVAAGSARLAQRVAAAPKPLKGASTKPAAAPKPRRRSR